VKELKILQELQYHVTQLDELNKRLENLNGNKDIEKLDTVIQQKEYDLINKKTQYEINNVKIQRYEQKLNQLNFSIKEINEKLYSGEISNVAQLEQMQKDNNESKEEAGKIEEEAIELMEYTEKLKDEIDKLEEHHRELVIQSENSEDEYIKKLDSIEKEIEIENQHIQDRSNKLDEKLLKIFNKLRDKKGKAVVGVIGDKCTGCHMNIPIVSLSKIKNPKAINYCDNCGRILYYDKEQELE